MSKRVGLYVCLGTVYLAITYVWFGWVTPKTVIDPALTSYYNAFIKPVQRSCYMREYNSPNQIVVQFKKLPGNDIGSCEQNAFRYVVNIDPFMWQYLSDADKTQVMFHELGHCVFNLDHVENDSDFMNSELHKLSYQQIYFQLARMIRQNCTLWENHDRSNGS